MNKTQNQKQQTKNEHTTNNQQTTKNQDSNHTGLVYRFGVVSSESVVSGSKRVVVGSESEWYEFLCSRSRSDLDALRKIWHRVYAEKFASSRKDKSLSRNVYRVFSSQDLLDFFNCVSVKEIKAGVGFFLMLTGGFRIGELNQFRTQDLDCRRGVVSLLTEKAKVYSDQVLPSVAFEVLDNYIEVFQDKICENEDYILFSENLFYDRKNLSTDYLRNAFGKIRKKATLCSQYATRDDSNNKKHKTNRPLHKLSSHSLRRTYLTELYRDCNKKELVKVLARHKKRDVTDQYIFFSHQEQLELVNKVFNREPYTTIAKDLIEKIKHKGGGKNEL